MPIPHDNSDDLIARVRGPHGYWFAIRDKCPMMERREDDTELLPKLTRREKRRLKKGKL